MTNGVNDPPTVVFLFGAGASFGSKDCLPRPPPLGANLFKELRALGGTAAGIDDSLAARFENFEVGMAEFRATRDHELTPFLLEMGHFFSSFEPGPHNYYRKLLEVILKSNLKIVLSTLNYDLLIEHAILHVGRAYCYAQNSGPALSLLKIHGSCNFVPDVPGVFRNLQFSGCQTIIDAPAKPLSIAETRQFYSTEQAFPPVMSLYAKGKNVVSCPKFVETQLRDWGRAIAFGARDLRDRRSS